MLFAMPALAPLDHEVIERVLELRRELRHSLATRRRWTGALRRVAFARAVQSSNSIEGYHVSIEDAAAAVDGDVPIDAAEGEEAWRAVVGYRRAMTYILQLADDPGFAHSDGLIRSLHYMMLEDDLGKLPGRWRPGPVYVHDTGSGEVVYEGPAAELVPGLMTELIDVLNADEPHHALARAAMAHLNLVMIHPFKDGNGRMARALQSLVLAREGILSPEFASIEEYLGAHTQDYYDALAEVGRGSWNPDGDATPWLRFCLTAHYRQARTLLRRTRETGRVWEAVEQRVERAGLSERMVAPVYIASSGMRLRNETYRSIAEVSPAAASRDLRLAVEAALLVPHGEKRGRFYTAADDLRDLRVSMREAVREKDLVDPYAQPSLLGEGQSPARRRRS